MQETESNTNEVRFKSALLEAYRNSLWKLVQELQARGEGQGSLVCCSPWGHKEWTQLSKTTTAATWACSSSDMKEAEEHALGYSGLQQFGKAK